MIEKTYRITGSRHDVPEYYIDEFTVVGQNVDDCDQQAVDRFKPHVFKKSNAWEDLMLRRIDTRPVIKDVISGGRLQRLKKLNLPDNHPGLLPSDDD